MTLRPSDVDRFESSRPRLEAIAYRLLGSATEAEDIVQEAYLRWQNSDAERIKVPAAWLTKVVTNLCLNQLSSARVRSETYVGTWLPEPLLAKDPMMGPAETVEQRESVSYAMMTLLERLSPRERVVYVLREAFDYAHREIAEILETTETNTQQLLHRARQHLTDGRERATADSAMTQRLVEQFLAAAGTGRIEALVELLTEDAVSIGDGGGKIPVRMAPFRGPLPVARFLRGLFTPGPGKRVLLGGPADLYLTTANGDPALVLVVDGRVVGILCLEITPTGIAALRIQVNPDKLIRASRHWAKNNHDDPVMQHI